MFYLRLTTFVILVLILLALSCSGPESEQPVLTAEDPLHLEEHLVAAMIEGSEIPVDAPKTVEWHFDKPQPNWKQISPFNSEVETLEQVQTADALRLVMDKRSRGFFGNIAPNLLGGIIYINLPDWKREDWDYISLQIRTSEKSVSLGALFNVSSQSRNLNEILGDRVNLEGDGAVHTYTMRADWSSGDWEGSWQQLGIGLGAQAPASVDILSISVMPKGAKFTTSPFGVNSQQRNNISHPTLYMYSPGKLSYRVKIPIDGFLDFGLGVLRNETPVTFRSTIKQKGKKEETVFEETYADKQDWIYRSVDLSSWKGRTITLTLEADSERSGTVALWAKPTIRGKRNDKKPNFIIIVLDALRADHMAAYGYYRNTAPNIEKRLDRCIIFKNAYSQAAATPGSTASLFTSTYKSAHGVTMPGNPGEGLPILDKLPTLAEVLKENGYYTKAISVTDWVSIRTGYGKGFEDFELVDLPASWDRSLNEAQITAESIIDFLGGDLKQPFFLYVHMHGPHWPYDPPEKFNIFQNKVDSLPPFIARLDKTQPTASKDYLDEAVSTGKLTEEDLRYLKDRYDGAIYQNDAALKEVFDIIKNKGLYENTMIIVTADHGDQLMEHGWIGHWMPYNDTLHVPLFVNYPPLFKNRESRDDIVETIGIGPTIVSQAGIEKPVTFKGEDLLAGKSKDYAITEGITWWKIQNHKWSLIYNTSKKTFELYDLENDPSEFQNVADQHSDIVRMLTNQFKGEIQSSIIKIRKVKLDQKTIERLKALGYIK